MHNFRWVGSVTADFQSNENLVTAITATIKAIVAKYPNDERCEYKGRFRRGTNFMYDFYTYDNKVDDSGLPQYGFGYFMSWANIPNVYHASLDEHIINVKKLIITTTDITA